ncbi:STY4851/ECs_5259 family protein [Marinobacterium jannaschii]|uniref:STY4851/ECs_5259 family protein n=1 Tax=Marinobacterium jannaschii TaxID=64970 RepID=UPI000484ACD6|nr:STY4851/ECs_5259 family protein [Marinobacterium jannaschii]
MAIIKSRAKAWLSEFLFTRGILSPKAIPIYKYCITEDEFRSLSDLIRVSFMEKSNALYSRYWSACFCLFVAEKFRRNYDASWSWKAFEKSLGVELSQNERKEAVQEGLGYWSRPVRYREHGADYLGSLFAEGGLPWKLIQNESHGFGRAVKAGLRRYLQYKSEGRNIKQLIKEYGIYFPKTFQTEEKYELLANVVETLMALAESQDLDKQKNPAEYLNNNYPQWRDEFPLPLEEKNGYALVNEWLVDAGIRLEERNREREIASYFTCEHRLYGEMERGYLSAQVTLAPSLKLKLNGRKVSSTRVELVLYEGEEAALKVGAAYGRLDDDGLDIKMPVTALEYRRKYPEKPLLLTCWCAGEKLHTVTIQSSEVDWHKLPAAFIKDGDDVRLLGTASVKTSSAGVLVRVPPALDLNGSVITPIATDVNGSSWYCIDSLTVIKDRNSRYVIEPGSASGNTKIELRGALSGYDTLPVTTWLGWPRCVLRDSSGEEKQPDALLVNNKPTRQINAPTTVGACRVDILGDEGEVLTRRKIGVLPPDFSIAAMPATSQTSARIAIKTVYDLDISLANDSLNVDILKEGINTTVYFQPKVNHPKPERVLLNVRDPHSESEAVLIRLPYPEEGAQLLDSEGGVFEEAGVNLEQILGMTLVLTPPPESRQCFYVSLDFLRPEGALTRRYTYDLENQSAQISLFSLYEDVQSLLSVRLEQDAEIRVRIETTRLLKQFYIRRYDAFVRFTNEMRSHFEFLNHSNQPLGMDAQKAKVKAMQVHAPETTPVDLYPQSIVPGICTGVFELPEFMRTNGPWLLYPGSDSSVFFRPSLYISSCESLGEYDQANVKTLHSAARYFHPHASPDPFDAVLDKMSEDFMHSSWLYLAELKKNYGHMPLSSLEAWKHLAHHPQAMALAVFRLEMDSGFVTRLVQELAVVWEKIHVSQWVNAVKVYVDGVSAQFSVPAELVQRQALEKMESLSNQVPLFVSFAKQIAEAVRKELNLPGPPLQAVFSQWLQQLRGRQEDANWPTNLSEELTDWIRHQKDFSWLADLTMPGYMRSVCFIPIFAAAVSAGAASFEELTADHEALIFGIRVLSEFDRDGWYQPVYSAALSNLANKD